MSILLYYFQHLIYDFIKLIKNIMQAFQIKTKFYLTITSLENEVAFIMAVAGVDTFCSQTRSKKYN